MPSLIDLAYFAGLTISAPIWLIPPKSRKKVISAFRDRMGKDLPPSQPGRPPTVLLHAVSLGEINATRTLVLELLSRRPGLRVVVSATTATGYQRAIELYGATPGVVVARYPLDFSGAIGRFLDAFQPDVVALMELELWPNFLRICGRRDIPVLLVNGRLTQHSLQRYRLIRPISRQMLRSLALVCVQDDAYADRFARAGAPADRIVVTGSMKFDTAQLAADPLQVKVLGSSLSISTEEQLWVCGSTGPGEEAICLRAYEQLSPTFPKLRLVLVPRKPERFDEVADYVRSAGHALRRRSNPAEVLPATAGGSSGPAVILGDTMGELRLFYALASVVFVGRTAVDLGPKLHGSDMLEPAALGKPVVVGPFTGNFAEAMQLLRKNKAIIEIAQPTELVTVMGELLSDPDRREKLGSAARAALVEGQGATARHADRILARLPS